MAVEKSRVTDKFEVGGKGTDGKPAVLGDLSDAVDSLYVHESPGIELTTLDLDHHVGTTGQNLGIGPKFGEGGQGLLDVIGSPEVHVNYLFSRVYVAGGACYGGSPNNSWNRDPNSSSVVLVQRSTQS